MDDAIAQYRLAAYLDPAFACPGCGWASWPAGGARTARRPPTWNRRWACSALEHEERIMLFGGGFGRMALTMLCRPSWSLRGAPMTLGGPT